MRAIAYIRVSTQEQELGLEAQRTAIALAAVRLGVTVAATFTDQGFSGALAIEARPGLLDAVAALKRGDVLLVAKRDRLGRDVVNVALVERLAQRRGARIVSAAGEGTDDTGPSGLLLRTIIDAFAQHERLIIAERTRRALGVKRTRGERISGALPFGFALAADGVRLVPHPDEQRALVRLRELRGSGLTLRETAARLTAAGYRLRSGQPWTIARVHALSREARRARAA